MMGNRNFLVQSKHQQLHPAYPPIHRLMALTVPRCSFRNKSANSPNRFACFLLLLFLLLAERPYFRTLEKVMVMPSQSASRTRAEKNKNNIKNRRLLACPRLGTYSETLSRLPPPYPLSSTLLNSFFSYLLSETPSDAVA